MCMEIMTTIYGVWKLAKEIKVMSLLTKVMQQVFCFGAQVMIQIMGIGVTSMMGTGKMLLWTGTIIEI